VLIIGGYYWYSKSKTTTTAVQYKTAKVEKGIITTSISASGNVVVDQSSNVDPTITGTVANLAVNVGDKVKKGQTLFTIINDDLGISANKALTSYNSAVIAKNQAQADNSTAKIAEEHDSHSYTAAELKAFHDKLQVANEQVDTAWASYLSAKEDANKRTVKASIDGTINAINIANGDDLSRLSSSSTSSAPIIIGDLSTLKAQVDVNEVDIADVKVGQKTTITFDAIDDLNTTGKVEKIDALGTLTSGVVTYNVTIGFDSLDERIKSQMSVSTEIIVNSKQDIITVSNSVIKTRNGENYVQVLVNGKPEDHTVEIGIANDTGTEIISGVSVGDNVITQTTNSPTSKSTTSSSSNSSSTSSSSKSSSSSNGPPGGGMMGF
jgi:macrolide-specific efflux system membrane fusion protein